jgi:hypothetical protein
MPDTWTTHRGDGWWYSGSQLEAQGEFNRSPAALWIGDVKFRGTPTSQALHELLWASAQRFPGEQVRLIVSRELRPLLELLGQSGCAEWVTVKHPLSEEARFTRIDSPSPGEPR